MEADVCARLMISAVLSREAGDDERLKLWVIKDGESIGLFTLPTKAENWAAGHITPGGETVYPGGKGSTPPPPAKFRLLVPSAKKTAPLDSGRYMFAVIDEASAVLAKGQLSVGLDEKK